MGGAYNYPELFGLILLSVRVTHQKENIMLVICSHLYIDSGRWYLCHVPSTFATVNTHANVFFVFLHGGISKEWRHIVSAICDF